MKFVNVISKAFYNRSKVYGKYLGVLSLGHGAPVCPTSGRRRWSLIPAPPDVAARLAKMTAEPLLRAAWLFSANGPDGSSVDPIPNFRNAIQHLYHCPRQKIRVVQSSICYTLLPISLSLMAEGNLAPSTYAWRDTHNDDLGL